MEKTYTKFIAPGIIFTGCLVVMQMHAIPFWENHMGNSGMLFSVILEIAAVWHWLHKQAIIGGIISFLLVSGPLAEISEPLIVKYQAQLVNEKLLSFNESILQSNQAVEEKLLESNWAGMIQKNQTQKKEKEDRVRELLVEQKDSTAGWLLISYTVMQGIGLIVLLLTQIHLLRYIRKIWDLNMTSLREVVPVAPEPKTQVEIQPVNVVDSIRTHVQGQRIYEMLCQLKEDINGTWKNVSECLEIPQSSINRVKNLLEGKSDAASEDMLLRIEQRILNYERS